jgi:hypothetical protein
MEQLEMSRVMAIHTEVEGLNADRIQSSEVVIEIGLRLAAYLPYTGQQMALAKKIMNQKRKEAYDQLVFTQRSLNQPVYPSTMKDYVNAQCCEEMYNYDLCERANRSIVHALDFLRSVLSTLKEEMKISQYQNFNP